MNLKQIKMRIETGILTARLVVVGVKCPTCKKIYHKPIEVSSILFGAGECLSCDHVRGDVEDIMRDKAREASEHDLELLLDETGESLSRFDMEDFGRNQ